MPDSERQSPSVGDFNYKIDTALYRTPKTPGYSEDELEEIFSFRPRKYQQRRALAAYCLVVNTGFWPRELRGVNVRSINQAEKTLYHSGRIYVLRLWPCTILSYIKERRYRPGVTALFTTFWGTPQSRSSLNLDFGQFPIPVSTYRLRATYFESRPRYT